ncbi:MAG TPA: HAD hydrolase-like protein [Candidatus Nanopelagicales bacterium]|nr:HAD hydrolase-like protein [Candidatus Nanopelagicales bacterium]
MSKPANHPANKPDIVLFDLDGTLTDAAPGIVNGIRLVFDHFGVEQPDETTMRTHLGPPLAVTWREHYNFTDEQVTQALVIYREYYHEVGMFENEVFAGIPELLTSLNNDDITLATATSKPDFSATRIIEHFGLRDHFAFIGAANLEGTRDSKALVVGHTLEQLNANAATHRILMVGDRHHDVHGAREHGIDTIGVLWGYGDADELTEAGAIALIDEPSTLRGQWSGS